MKFLHCADIHLDSPLAGLDTALGDLAAELRLATRRAFDNVIALALEERVDFVLIAGDVYDIALKDFSAPLYFGKRMGRLAEAGIPVAIVFGNHDAADRRKFDLKAPDRVHVLAADKPESVEISGGVWVHGRSFASSAETANLVAGYPPPKPSEINIGLLHTSLDGAPGHDRYAPCTAEELANKGYDYWALGHVHQRREVRAQPSIQYPGNPQGRSFRETGEKGCLLVAIDPTTKACTVQFRPTAVALWLALGVDVSGAANLDAAVEQVAAELRKAVAGQSQERPVVVRVTLTGVCRADAQLRDQARLRAEVQSAAEGLPSPVALERIVVRTHAALDAGAWAQRDDPLGEILRGIQGLAADPAAVERILQELEPLRTKLPAEAGDEPDALRVEEGLIRALAPEVEQDLLARLAPLAAEERE